MITGVKREEKTKQTKNKTKTKTKTKNKTKQNKKLLLNVYLLHENRLELTVRKLFLSMKAVVVKVS